MTMPAIETAARTRACIQPPETATATATPPVNDPTLRQIEKDTDILARTIYGEARSELVRGQEAVAAVVINRVRRARDRGGQYWWGSSIEQVCLKPWQFSCWNATDPNREKILKVTANNRTFRACLRVARRAVTGTLKDATDGAAHYHTKEARPAWSRRRAPCVEIGRHQFYNDVK